jgi:hypothetical protein
MSANQHPRETTRRLTVEGQVSLDGDCIYVNGMTLANLIRAFEPPETDLHSDRIGQSYSRLTITIELEPARR